MKKSPMKNMAYWKSKSGIAPLKQVNNPAPTNGADGMIAEKIEEKVNKVVNQQTGEGLV